MPTVQHTHKQTQPDEAVNFLVPADFKLELDLAVKRERTTLRDFCTRALAEKLGLPVPGEEPDAAKRRAS